MYMITDMYIYTYIYMYIFMCVLGVGGLVRCGDVVVSTCVLVVFIVLC